MSAEERTPREKAARLTHLVSGMHPSGPRLAGSRRCRVAGAGARVLAARRVSPRRYASGRAPAMSRAIVPIPAAVLVRIQRAAKYHRRAVYLVR